MSRRAQKLMASRVEGGFWMRAGYAVGLFRLLPVGVLDAVVGLMGINASMDHFVQTRSAPSG